MARRLCNGKQCDIYYGPSLLEIPSRCTFSAHPQCLYVNGGCMSLPTFWVVVELTSNGETIRVDETRYNARNLSIPEPLDMNAVSVKSFRQEC